MSRNVQATKKPYCKVCFDAGKPESEYTSHWVRSLPDRTGKSKVTCPTLLNTECRYCYQSGHTAKFCPAIKQQDKERENREKAAKVEKTKFKVQEKKKSSAFAGLMESDSEDEENVSKKVRPVENYPVLCVESEKPKQEVKTGWAAIVAKPAEVKKVVEPTKPTGLVLLSDYIKPEPKAEEKKVAPWANKQPVVTKSWADESDSEDEDQFDDDLKWRNTYVPGMSDDVWSRVNGEYDSTW